MRRTGRVLKPLLEKQHTQPDGWEVGNSSRCRGGGGCEGEVGVRGSSDTLSDPICVTKVLAEAQESRGRLMAGEDEGRDLTSKSSSEYRTLFLWKGWGQEERREHQ